MGKSRYKVARNWLLFWCLFIGIGAVAGSFGMLVAPDGSALGMNEMLPFFQVLPFADVLFQDFIFSGIALLIVNGLTNLFASILIVFKKKLGVILGCIFGVTLMLWICIQFYMFPFNFMSTIYFIFGLIQFSVGYAAIVFFKQEKFQAEQKYTEAVNKGEGDTLVVYFSRMGYTKKYAYQIKNELNADIIEIKSTELTKGTKGFWWCGRFGMHRWGMPIEEIEVDLTKYKKIIICSPIWVFNICAPIREFCKKYSGKISEVEYVLVHFQKNEYRKAITEMDNLLQIKHKKAISICFRKGKEIKKYNLD